MKVRYIFAVCFLAFFALGCSCEDNVVEYGDDGGLQNRGDTLGDDDDTSVGGDDDDVSDDDDNDDDTTGDDAGGGGDTGGDTGGGGDDDDDDDDAAPDTPPEFCAELISEWDFGKVEVNFSSSITIEIANCGEETLEILDASLDPVVGEIYRSPIYYDTLLAWKEKAQFTLIYAPQNVGVDTAVFTIKTNVKGKETIEIPLRGEGVQTCDVRCVPVEHDYGTVEVGQRKRAKFMCENRGQQAASVTNITLNQGSSSDFAIEIPSLPKLLNRFQAVAFYADYNPKSFGYASATVEVEVSTCPETTLGITIKGHAAEDILPTCQAERSFNPRIKWEWDGQSSSLPTFNNVFMMPVAAPLWDNTSDGVIDENDIPVVVFAGYDPTKMVDMQKCPAAVHLVDGKKGIHITTFATPGQEVHFGAELAIGDINNDGIPEIIGTKFRDLPGCECPKDYLPFDPMKMCCKHEYGTLLAFDREGRTLWESEQWDGDVRDQENMSAPYLADLNADGVTEILYGNYVFNNLGKIIWQGHYGRGNTGKGFVSVAADLDGDGKLEVIVGNTAYRYDGTLYWQVELKDKYGKQQEGIPAIADLDLDGKPEVIVNTFFGVYYLNGQTGSVIVGPLGVRQGGCCVTTPSVNDLDGDGYPEVVIPNYLKYDGQDTGEEKVPHIMLALNHDGSTLWTNDINDDTGAAFATTFDFEGDGAAEVVYADEQHIYIIRGNTGDVLYQEARPSHTGSDAPIVLDVDNNKHAELVAPCEPGGKGVGLRVYFTEPEAWMNTRKVWNQTGYHITNIDENIKVPKVPMDSWGAGNIYRGNVPICR